MPSYFRKQRKGEMDVLLKNELHRDFSVRSEIMILAVLP